MAQPPDRRAPGRRGPGAAALWGDGFAGDGLRDLWAVRDWSLCSPDEYTLVFPRLLPRAGEFPAALRVHLEGCVAARAWRLARLEGREASVPLRSRLPDGVDGAVRHRDWFADADAVTCLLRRLGLLRTLPERVDAERELLLFLDGVLCGIQSGRRPPFDAASEALLAFGAGLHPAYLWPEATLSHARGLAAGWLGHLDRGRAALMPPAVADYILEALGAGAPADPQLAALAGGEAGLERLRDAARRRLDGRDAPVRLAPGPAPRAGLFPGFAAAGRTREAEA